MGMRACCALGHIIQLLYKCSNEKVECTGNGTAHGTLGCGVRMAVAG
jgi:hypothetical protein